MLKLAPLLVIVFLAGCASAPADKISYISKHNYAGESVDKFLSQMSKHGLFCQRLSKYEKDTRLEKFTDGTLKDVGFYQCIASDDGGLCMHNVATYMMSQYGKVIRVHGNQTSKSCLWN